MNFISLFSGGGGVDIGAMAAGLTPVGAIEHDPDIATVYMRNIRLGITVSDILEQDPRDYPHCDLLHASPPCPNFSAAKTNRAESEQDLALAGSVARFLRVLKPRWFTLENVPFYSKSKSYGIILAALADLDYMYDANVLNSADFGVPQTRRRIFVRAVHNGLVPHLPQPVKWQGWYQAIEDLIPALPESHFAEWQLKRLPEFCNETIIVDSAGYPDKTGATVLNARKAAEPANTIVANYQRRKLRAFIIGGANTSDEQAAPGVGVSELNEPTRSVTPNANRWRAFLVDDQNSGVPDLSGQRGLTIRQGDEPSHTVSATQAKRSIRAWLSQGCVVAMTPRCLARFQSFPDWYELPKNNNLACKIIGNVVPPLMYEAIARTFLTLDTEQVEKSES